MSVRVGFGAADITPPVGTPMSGYPQVRLDLPWTPGAIKGYVGTQDVSQGVHDSLQAVALAIEVGSARAVLIGLDTLVVTLDFTDRVRAALGADGVRPDEVLIGASHTHAGADVFAWWDGDPVHSPEPATREAAIKAARAALAALEHAELTWGESAIDHISINRRDEVCGPIDPAVAVLTARSAATGRVLGVLTSFACHPITLDYSNLLFSADYVWALREAIAARHPGARCVFLNGCAGNINPTRFPYEPRANIYIPQIEENYPVYWGGPDDMRRMGSALGDAALAAIEGAAPLVVPGIEGDRRHIELPLKQDDDLEAFLEFMNFSSVEYSERLRNLVRLPSEVQRIRIGELAIVGLPGEPFVEIGLAIKDSSAGGPLLVAGYSNDDVRYVLTDDAYDGGQYETVGTPLAAGSAPALVAAGVGLL